MPAPSRMPDPKHIRVSPEGGVPMEEDLSANPQPLNDGMEVVDMIAVDRFSSDDRSVSSSPEAVIPELFSKKEELEEYAKSILKTPSPTRRRAAKTTSSKRGSPRDSVSRRVRSSSLSPKKGSAFGLVDAHSPERSELADRLEGTSVGDNADAENKAIKSARRRLPLGSPRKFRRAPQGSVASPVQAQTPSPSRQRVKRKPKKEKSLDLSAVKALPKAVDGYPNAMNALCLLENEISMTLNSKLMMSHGLQHKRDTASHYGAMGVQGIGSAVGLRAAGGVAGAYLNAKGDAVVGRTVSAISQV